MSSGDHNVEIIHTSRRYHLVAGENFYGVLDTESDDLERFPETDEGLDRAERRFDELRRLDRRRRWAIERILIGVVAVGAVVWIAGGILVAASFIVQGVQLPFEWFQGLDSVGFRITIGALAVLSAMLLVRLARRAEARGIDTPGLPSARLAGAVVAVSVGALIVWGVAGFVLHLVPQVEPVAVPFEFGEIYGGGEFTLAYRIVDAVSTLALRVWVVGVVVLGLTFLGQRLQGRETSSPGSATD